jgi:hypothetical protein
MTKKYIIPGEDKIDLWPKSFDGANCSPWALEVYEDGIIEGIQMRDMKTRSREKPEVSFGIFRGSEGQNNIARDVLNGKIEKFRVKYFPWEKPKHRQLDLFND